MNLTPAQIVEAIDSGRLIDDDGILSQVCKHCDEAWPFDSNSWGPKKEMRLGLDAVCRACRTEERRQKRMRQKQKEVA